MESASNVSTMSRMTRPDVVIFISQVCLLFVVVITALINLSLDHGNTNLWTMVLTSCLGYMMPNPHLKATKAKVHEVVETPPSVVPHAVTGVTTTPKTAQQVQRTEANIRQRQQQLYNSNPIDSDIRIDPIVPSSE